MNHYIVVSDAMILFTLIGCFGSMLAFCLGFGIIETYHDGMLAGFDVGMKISGDWNQGFEDGWHAAFKRMEEVYKPKDTSESTDAIGE